MKKNSLESFFLRNWYGKSRWTFLLLPLHWIFIFASGFRRWLLVKFKQRTPTIPVIVVGNISIGGTGKTPLLIALVKKLKAEGYSPAVISRGYGSQAVEYPYVVNHDSRVIDTGDEPFVIFQQTHCPVVIGPNRLDSISLARDQQNVDIILSDDGLQDYRLGRHLELAVVDGQRWFGNGWRLPVGPLREPISRLSACDMVIVNSPSSSSDLENFYTMHITPGCWVNIQTGTKLVLEKLQPGGKYHAVAGIGNPQRFYQTLNSLGYEFVEHDFPDHYAYIEEDFIFAGDSHVLMTEKDAVKCKHLAKSNWYYLAVDAQLDDFFWQKFMEKVRAIRVQKIDLKLQRALGRSKS